jgi:hypothetical protein
VTLSPEQISGLLAPKPSKVKPVKKEHERTVFQTGPIRFFDLTMRCASRGCGSPTTWKLQGIPKCSMHLITECNRLLMEAGVE